MSAKLSAFLKQHNQFFRSRSDHFHPGVTESEYEKLAQRRKDAKVETRVHTSIQQRQKFNILNSYSLRLCVRQIHTFTQ